MNNLISKFVKNNQMTIVAIRQKLSAYLKVADEKKVKAIYALLEDDIKTTESINIDQYNKELQEALAEADAGNFITQAEMEKRIAKW